MELFPLKTDYLDDEIQTNTNRKYNITENSDGTHAILDVTNYIQEGDIFAAKDINTTNEAINSLKIDVDELKNSSGGSSSGGVSGGLVCAMWNARLTLSQDDRLTSSTSLHAPKSLISTFNNEVVEKIYVPMATKSNTEFEVLAFRPKLYGSYYVKATATVSSNTGGDFILKLANTDNVSEYVTYSNNCIALSDTIFQVQSDGYFGIGDVYNDKTFALFVEGSIFANTELGLYVRLEVHYLGSN
ncbi:MAG: hypothetical protein ATN36_06640 [Epulopiscium sp. Nele67-Bin005]|nr:MAG: hypothetical protein ATN36_06640 [Epulopiscium sp. Nele67-Bin005]